MATTIAPDRLQSQIIELEKKAEVLRTRIATLSEFAAKLNSELSKLNSHVVTPQKYLPAFVSKADGSMTVISWQSYSRLPDALAHAKVYAEEQSGLATVVPIF